MVETKEREHFAVCEQLRSELESLRSERDALAGTCQELEKRAKSLAEENAERKNAGSEQLVAKRCADLEAKLKKAEAALRAAKAAEESSRAAALQKLREEHAATVKKLEAELRTAREIPAFEKEEFYRKREKTLLTENKMLEDQLWDGGLLMPGCSTSGGAAYSDCMRIQETLIVCRTSSFQETLIVCRTVDGDVEDNFAAIPPRKDALSKIPPPPQHGSAAKRHEDMERRLKKKIRDLEEAAARGREQLEADLGDEKTRADALEASTTQLRAQLDAAVGERKQLEELVERTQALQKKGLMESLGKLSGTVQGYVVQINMLCTGRVGMELVVGLQEGCTGLGRGAGFCQRALREREVGTGCRAGVNELGGMSQRQRVPFARTVLPRLYSAHKGGSGTGRKSAKSVDGGKDETLANEIAELQADRAELLKRCGCLEQDLESVKAVHEMDMSEMREKLAVAEDKVGTVFSRSAFPGPQSRFLRVVPSCVPGPPGPPLFICRSFFVIYVLASAHSPSFCVQTLYAEVHPRLGTAVGGGVCFANLLLIFVFCAPLCLSSMLSGIVTVFTKITGITRGLFCGG